MTAAASTASTRPTFGPLIVPLLALAVFINYVDRGNLATAAPLLTDELALTGAQIGLLTSAFFWTYTPGQLLAGWMSEKFNGYRTLAIGLALWALATFFTGFATGFVMIFILRLLLGLGESAIFPCSSKLIAQHVHGQKLGFANSLLTVGLSVGPAFGIFFGGLLMAQFGWRGVFLLFGALSLLWLIPWIAATRKLSAEADQPTPEHGEAPPFFAILGRRELWGAALGHLGGNFGFYFVISWLPLYLVKARGFSITEMSFTGGFVYLAFGGAAVLGGLATDRWIASGATPNLARKTVLGGGNLLGVVSLLACAFAPSDAVALACLFVATAGLGLASPHIFAAAQTLAGPRAAGKWVGVQNCFGNFSGIVGPIVTGLIIDQAGYPTAFVVTSVLTTLGVLGWVVVIPKIAPIDWSKA